MITLYRTEPCDQCDQVADALADMVIAHEVVVLERGAVVEEVSPGTPLPAIRDGDRTVSGDEIPSYLRELNRVLEEWSRFQGDSCYIDADGTVC